MSQLAYRQEFIPEAPWRETRPAKPAELVPFPVPVQTTDRLHPGVQGVALLAYAWIFVVLWLVFGSNRESAFAVAISTFYAVMFFGVPLVMLRMARNADPARPHGSLGGFLRGAFETITGPITGWQALAQVALIPAALSFGFTAIGLIIALQR